MVGTQAQSLPCLRVFIASQSFLCPVQCSEARIRRSESDLRCPTPPHPPVPTRPARPSWRPGWEVVLAVRAGFLLAVAPFLSGDFSLNKSN